MEQFNLHNRSGADDRKAIDEQLHKAPEGYFDSFPKQLAKRVSDVPEGYFDSFAGRVMERIREEAPAEKSKVGFGQYMGIAATALILLCSGLLLNYYQGNRDVTIAEASESSEPAHPNKEVEGPAIVLAETDPIPEEDLAYVADISDEEALPVLAEDLSNEEVMDEYIASDLDINIINVDADIAEYSDDAIADYLLDEGIEMEEIINEFAL